MTRLPRSSIPTVRPTPGNGFHQPAGEESSAQPVLRCVNPISRPPPWQGRGRSLPDVQVNTGNPPSDAVLDDLILKQAMLTGALEILPDRLANVAILPLQLRLVYMIGQHFGQKLDANQVKDLAGALGLGAAAQVMESVVRKVLGGIAGGIPGGMVGGVTGLAAGAAVSFSSTYALGHVAKQLLCPGTETQWGGPAESLRPVPG